jgi:hypothetical protein
MWALDSSYSRKETEMAEETKSRCGGATCGALIGPVWGMGWLFTIGFLHLSFWKIVLAIVLWPYYLGAFFGK